MPDREKVIKGLEGISGYFFDIYRNDTDSYKCEKAQEYSDDAIDAIALLKEQETMMQCIKGKCCICPHCDNCDVDENGSLKEQEAKHPVCEKCGKEIDHINTSVFNYDGSDSDYSIPITYSKENGCVSFSTSQKWTGYDLTDKEQKERIRCPYCGKFPFDDSIEIEFYEPVEVMMWTSEGR